MWDGATAEVWLQRLAALQTQLETERRTRSVVLGPPAANRGQRRRDGAVYTPHALVAWMNAIALTPTLQRIHASWSLFTPEGTVAREGAIRPDPAGNGLSGAPARGGDACATVTRASHTVRILDPACGDGRFLRGMHALAPCVATSGITFALTGYEQQSLVAQATAARLPMAQIVCTDALAHPLKQFDVVVGNPPYVRGVRLHSTAPAQFAALRGRFAATSFGEWDLYAVFLEHSLAWLAPRGRAVWLVPPRWLHARGARGLRAVLAPHLVAVVDFGATQMFRDTTVYSSVVVLEAQPAQAHAAWVQRQATGWQTAAISRANLTQAACEGWSVALGAPGPAAPRAVETGGVASARAVAPTTGNAPPSAVGHASPTTGHQPQARITVAADARSPLAPTTPWSAPQVLGDIARVAKGLGTNADSVFVFAAPAVSEDTATLSTVALRHGSPVRIERARLRPIWRGRDVGIAPSWCLWPYEDSGALVSPQRFARDFPHAWAYLLAQRSTLAARERGRYGDAQFYRYGRLQNVAWLQAPIAKIIIPDIAAPDARGARRAVIDDRGTLVLDSAYAVRAHAHCADEPWAAPARLHALLTSRWVTAWVGCVGATLRGGYVRLKTAALQRFPLPPTPPSTALDAAIARGDATAIGAELRIAYGDSAARWAPS